MAAILEHIVRFTYRPLQRGFTSPLTYYEYVTEVLPLFLIGKRYLTFSASKSSRFNTECPERASPAKSEVCFAPAITDSGSVVRFPTKVFSP